jgi:hypothetical protein
MPGFFATAAALWLHARHARPERGQLQRAAAGVLALVLAFAGALTASPAVVRQFAGGRGIVFTTAATAPSAACAFAGAYTLLTWSVFVLACRRALRRRTLRPFVAAAILAGGLVFARPWTVDDFTSHWSRGVVAGDIVAERSLALVFVIAALLAASERHSAKPQPGETLLPRRRAPREHHDNDVGGDGDRVEAR